MDFENHLGLGFGQHLSDQNLDDLMKSYMEQCIQYDEQQRELSAKEDAAVHRESMNVPKFVPASVLTLDHQASCMDHHNTHTQQEEQLRSSMERAKAIVAKFSNLTSSNRMHVIPSSQDDASSYPYAQRRFDFLQQFHRKLQDAFLKNLTYLADRDQHHLEHIQQVQQHILKQDIVHSVSGIGSKERKFVQKERIRKGHDVSSNLTHCGVYITGLSCQDEEETEENHTLASLFGSYGKISKIKLYHDKMTQKKKGDGLILYDWPSVRKDRIIRGEHSDDDNDAKEFLSWVCGQLNGVELPSGIVIHVEPACLDHDKIKNENKKDVVQMEQADSKNDPDVPEEDDDLDDFFASL